MSIWQFQQICEHVFYTCCTKCTNCFLPFDLLWYAVLKVHAKKRGFVPCFSLHLEYSIGCKVCQFGRLHKFLWLFLVILYKCDKMVGCGKTCGKSGKLFLVV